MAIDWHAPKSIPRFLTTGYLPEETRYAIRTNHQIRFASHACNYFLSPEEEERVELLRLAFVSRIPNMTMRKRQHLLSKSTKTIINTAMAAAGLKLTVFMRKVVSDVLKARKDVYED